MSTQCAPGAGDLCFRAAKTLPAYHHGCCRSCAQAAGSAKQGGRAAKDLSTGDVHGRPANMPAGRYAAARTCLRDASRARFHPSCAPSMHASRPPATNAMRGLDLEQVWPDSCALARAQTARPGAPRPCWLALELCPLSCTWHRAASKGATGQVTNAPLLCRGCLQDLARGCQCQT